MYYFSEHTFNYVHGQVNLCPLDIETGHHPDGVLARGEEENAPESRGVEDGGGQRGILEGDAPYEAPATDGGGNEGREVGRQGGKARVEVVRDGGDVGLEGWSGESCDDVVPETSGEDGASKGRAVRACGACGGDGDGNGNGNGWLSTVSCRTSHDKYQEHRPGMM